MSAFLSEIRGRIGGARTPAEHYRVLIDIQKHATPSDVASLAASPCGSGEFDRAIATLSTLMTAANREVRTFELERIGDSVSLYSGKQRPRALVVAFCDKSDLLFMPLPVVLQYFNPERTALLIVRDPGRSRFSRGIPGHSASFPEMMERLAAEARFSVYHDVRYFGTSHGGIAALAAGATTGSRYAVTFAAYLPPNLMAADDQGSVAALIPIVRTAPKGNRYTCIFGAESRLDVKNARILAGLSGARPVAVPGVRDHNILFALHRRGELATLLENVGLSS